MLIPHLDVLIAQMVTFAIGMAAVWVIYLKPLGSHLKARREGIEKDLASAETARQEAEHLREQLRADRARLSDELRHAREEAKAEVARLREDLIAKAKAEQEALLKQGRQQIQAETGAAIAAVRGYAATLVVEATAKLLDKKLDSDSDKALAEKLVASVKVSKN